MLQRKQGQAGHTEPFGPHREELEAMGSRVSWRKALAYRWHSPDWGQMANKKTIAFRKSGMTDA